MKETNLMFNLHFEVELSNLGRADSNLSASSFRGFSFFNELNDFWNTISDDLFALLIDEKNYKWNPYHRGPLRNKGADDI